MAETDRPIWYLDRSTVDRHLPPVDRAIELARFVLDIVGRSSTRRTPKVSLSMEGGTFAQVLPARLDAADALDGSGLLGMKWIAGNPGNRARGLPAMSSLIALDDPVTGQPVAILDGSPITASRTAALSAAAIGTLAFGRAPLATALVLGGGVQGRAHLDVLAACGVHTAWLHDRHPERSASLANPVRDDGLTVTAVTDPRTPMHDADVVVSATSLGGATPWITAADVARNAIVVPVDYAAQVSAGLVEAATTFAVDDPETFREHRNQGRLAGWPEPTATLGDLARERHARPDGVAVALHQGPGLADIVFAAEVLRSARAAGAGIALPR